MKKLFRASRPTVDPLPPPTPPSTETPSSTPSNSLTSPQPAPARQSSQASAQPQPPPHQQQQQPVLKKSMAGLASMMESDHNRRRHHPSQGSVTPFPLGIGQQLPLQPQSQTHTQTQNQTQSQSPAPSSQQSTPIAVQHIYPPPAKQNRRGPPTLMEMRQDESRRASNPWQQPQLALTSSHSNGHDTPTSTPQAQFYLPPGARPPSPQSQFRPATPPNRGGRISQTSLGGGAALASSLGGTGFDNDGYTSGRSRGYSSASQSARGSDVDSNSHTFSAPVNPPTSPPVPAKNSKSPIPSRSPLAYDQASPIALPAPSVYAPVPMPNTMPPLNGASNSVPPPNVTQPNPSTNPWQSMPNGNETQPIVAPEEPPKEKKRFWGIGWGGDRRARSRERLRDDEEPRASMDEWREDSAFADDEKRNPNWLSRSINNLNIGNQPEQIRTMATPNVLPTQLTPGTANDVTTAIRLLCTQSDPSVAAILDVCERVNHSDSPDSVAKEAARCIRKEIKSGNEAERRTAAKVWLIMMRNISTNNFRQQASTKKFLQSLEPILLAPPGRPLVSISTHKLLVDILAGLTYQYGMEKGCEGLVELWKRVKLPQEPEFGIPLAADHPLYSPEIMSPLPNSVAFPLAAPSPPVSRGASRPPSEPHILGDMFRPQSPSMYGPGYARLPDHGEDMRRLREEINAARESARIFSEALVYTRPEELEYKTVIKEFYPKCFLAHESLTAQMGWAQSEAVQSRHREDSADSGENGERTTVEEQALADLFEVHGLLTEALKQYDELENMAADDREMREARERSKKETRMDKCGLTPEVQQASGSRAPSPAPPLGPQAMDPPTQALSTDSHSHQYHTQLRHSSATVGPAIVTVTDVRYRTPSPDRGALPLPQAPGTRLSASPSRNDTPSGSGRIRVPGPRPLPNPFRPAAGSNQSLHSVGTGLPTATATVRGVDVMSHSGHGHQSFSNAPSREGSGSTNDGSAGTSGDGDGEDDDEVENYAPPAKPSRKALGKRRAIVDEDNSFDPNDMFGLPRTSSLPRNSTDSDDSLTVDDIYLSKPIQYAYDAYQEKIQAEAEAKSSAGGVHVGDGVEGKVGSGSGSLEDGGGAAEQVGGGRKATSAGGMATGGVPVAAR